LNYEAFFAPDEEIDALSDKKGTFVLTVAANWAKVDFTNLLFCIFYQMY